MDIDTTKKRAYLEPDEVLRLIKHSGQQDTPLFIRFLWCTGCRCSEALAVTPGDIDYIHKRVQLPALKRKDQTTKFAVLWDDDLLRDLKGYCQNLAKHKSVFRFSRQIAYYRLRIAGQKAGLGKVHPHLLRHSMAINWALSGGSLQLLQRQLGHKSFSTTTDMYMKFSSDDILKEADRIFKNNKSA